MRTKLLALVFATAVTLTLVSLATAADPVNIQIMAVEEQPGKMILTVSAVDEKGKPFPGLDTGNFNAWINDQPLIIRSLQSETARLPASVLLLVDVSGSMAGEPMNQSRAAIQLFIDSLDAQDHVAVMSFANNVQLLQDFTTDRGALAHAVSRLAPVGETALYDGVIQAAQHMGSAPAGRKLIVLLSDGSATIGVNKRANSIQTTQASGVAVVAFGLGSGIDAKYLSELTVASGGRFLEASTPSLIKQAYADLASAIRSQYTLQVDVPRSIDRTVAGKLRVHVIYRADNAFAERNLEPLAGALPPPFSVTLSGLKPGDRPSGIVPLVPAVQPGIEVVKLDYFVDDNLIHTADAGAPGFDLDVSGLGTGGHVIKVVATDAAGREGEVQVPFIIPEVVAAASGPGLPLVPIAILAILALLALVVHRFFWKRIMHIVRGGDVYVSRVSSLASIRTSGPMQRPEDWPERPEPAAGRSPDDAVRGRVVVMDETAVRGGELNSIREFEMRSSPLTFGSGPNADMRVDDVGGLIAAEEARVWVQRGRLVYHKLTTLTAMATEGVTAGWQFLEDGDEMHIGPYRLIFQSQRLESLPPEETVAIPDRLPQEHGMALRPTGTDDAPGWSRTPDLQNGSQRHPSLHDFNTPGQDGAARTWGRDPAAASWGLTSRSGMGDRHGPDAQLAEDSEDDGIEATAARLRQSDEEKSTSQMQEEGAWENEDEKTQETQEPEIERWTVSETTTATDWQPEASDAASDEAVTAVEESPSPGWRPEEEGFSGWKSGEWTIEADEDDQA